MFKDKQVSWLKDTFKANGEFEKIVPIFNKIGDLLIKFHSKEVQVQAMIMSQTLVVCLIWPE